MQTEPAHPKEKASYIRWEIWYYIAHQLPPQYKQGLEKFSWHSSGIKTALIAAAVEVEAPFLKTLWRSASLSNILNARLEVNSLSLDQYQD